MSGVYAFDSHTHELVKIVCRGDKYSVYRLKEVRVIPVKVVAPEYDFTFEPEPFESWDYQPYDTAADVATDPAEFFDEVKRWTPYKVRL